MIKLFKLLFRLRTIRGLDKNDLLVVSVPDDYHHEAFQRLRETIAAMKLPCTHVVKPNSISMKVLTKWPRIQIPEFPELTINQVRQGLGLPPMENGGEIPYVHYGKRNTPNRSFLMEDKKEAS